MQSEKQVESFRKELANCSKDLVALNPKMTISLIEDCYNGMHDQMINQLQKHPLE